jgi:hypothetical protein
MNAAMNVDLSVCATRAGGKESLEIRGTVRNTSEQTLDTRVWASSLLVNGEPSMNWALAISNGLRDVREYALPPGESVEFRRILPAASLFPGPGQYTLILEVQGEQSDPVTIERE